MDITKEKQEIIEMFGVHFENIYNITPLAARILGVLIMDCCKTGMTFEELVDRMNASKSSVSTNLNLLLKMGKINYYTLSGDRKKYFKPAPFSDRMTNYLKVLDHEKNLIDKIAAYREKTASCDEERCNLENVRSYKLHVLEMEEVIRKGIARFRQIEEDNKI